jgi:hypothetical protein
MTARKPIRLGYEALHRILQAANKCSSNLDQAEFWSDLVHCVARFRLRSTYGKASFIRAREKRFSAIQKHAKELALLLKEDEAEEDVIGNNWREILPRDMLSPREFAEILNGLLMDLKHLWKEKSSDSLRNHLAMFEKEYGGGMSAFEMLAGAELALVFKKFFGDPSFSRTDEGPTGPFIKFVLAVLTEFKIKNRGKPYRAETIVAALTKARAGRPRRKGKTT